MTIQPLPYPDHITVEAIKRLIRKLIKIITK